MVILTKTDMRLERVIKFPLKMKTNFKLDKSYISDQINIFNEFIRSEINCLKKDSK